MRHLSLATLVTLLVGMWTTAGSLYAATDSVDLVLPDGTDLRLRVFPAEGHRRVIWLPSVFGQSEAEVALLTRLSGAGVEVWLADILASRFLPRVNSSLDAIPAEDVAAVVRAARARHDKRVFLVGIGRGAIPVLRGADVWSRTRYDRLQGILLLWPSLYVRTPEPGQGATYVPEVYGVTTPLVIFQPELSVRYWYLDRLQSALETNHIPVLTESIPGVRDGFFMMPEPLQAEIQLLDTFPSLFRSLLKRLEEIEP